MSKIKIYFYNFISRLLYLGLHIPFLKTFLLKVYDSCIKFYFDVEKYKKSDPYFMNSSYEIMRSKKIIEFISDKKYLNCLDIGCGNGFITYRLLPYCNKIIGLDISSIAIIQAKEKYPQKKLRFLVDNIRSVKLNKKYDLIVLADMLYYLGERLPKKEFLKIIQKICKLLKKNGRIIMSNYLPAGKTVFENRRNYNCYFSYFGLFLEKSEVISGEKMGVKVKTLISLFLKS